MSHKDARKICGLLLVFVMGLAFAPKLQAQRQQPPELKELVAATRIADPAARIKEFERIKAAYPNSQFMPRINQMIVSAKIELADTLEAVLSLQKSQLDLFQGPEKLEALAGSADEIISHPKLKNFPKAAVTSAVLAYRNDALQALGQPQTLSGIPPDQQKLFKGYFLGSFDVLLARAYLNQDDAAKAMATLGAYTKDGGTPDGVYFYTLAETQAKLGQSKEALESYLNAAADNYEDATDKAKALYIKLNGQDKGFEARLEAKLRELPYSVTPFKPSTEAKGKAVLAELFTGSECPPCVGTDLGFDGLLEAYPARYLVVLEYHLPIPRPDPMMNPATKKRQDVYGVNSTPTVVIDGTKKLVGGGSRGMAGEKFKQYAAEVDSLLKEAPGLALTVQAARTGDVVKVNCGFDRVQAGVELDVVLVQNEEKYKGGNGILFHKMVVRDLAVLDPAGGKTVSFDLAASEKATDAYLTDFEKTYTRIPNFKFAVRHNRIDRQGLKVVFFVQDKLSHKVLNAVTADVR